MRRARVLTAHVEISLAARDVDGAAAGVDELERIAADFDSVYLEAVAATGRGAVLLAKEDASRACVALRRAWRAWRAWHGLNAPYEAARVRLLLAQACRRLDDHDTADMEVDAARRVFEQPAAAPALVRATELSRHPGAAAPGGLTPGRWRCWSRSRPASPTARSPTPW